MSVPPIIPATNDVVQLLVAMSVNMKHIAATISSSGLGQKPHSVDPFPLGIEFFSRIRGLAAPVGGGVMFSFFLDICDHFKAAIHGKRSCVHSPAISRRVARRVAVVRRDRAHHPPRTDRPPAQHGT